MKPYLNVAVGEASQVGEARRAAMAIAADLGFDETRAGRLSLVVTELGNNLARHATQGRLLIGERRDPTTDERCIEVISLDKGPGMADVNECMRDGFSTAGTPGTGLGAVKRLSDAFDMHSLPSQGTLILSRVYKSAVVPRTGAFEVAGLCVAAPGETVCGDSWHVRIDGTVAEVLLADGLGHGPVAADAADAAVASFKHTRGAPSERLVAAHAALRSTRGAAAAAARLDAQARSVAFAGAGNISGRLVSGVDDRSLLSQHGTLGVQVRKLADIAYPWPPHACLILHSDGITTRWELSSAPGLLQADPALIAAWLLRDHLRGRDDATAVVIRLHVDA